MDETTASGGSRLHQSREPSRPALTPAPGAAFELSHQLFVLDAFLTARLDEHRCDCITRRFVDELLAVLDMQPLGELGIYPAVDRRAPGWSFVQPITTSHVSGHYFEKPGRKPNVRLDAYSCEPFDWRQLIEVCHRHFVLDEWHALFLHRDIDLLERRSSLGLTGRGADVLSECIMSAGNPPAVSS